MGRALIRLSGDQQHNMIIEIKVAEQPGVAVHVNKLSRVCVTL